MTAQTFTAIVHREKDLYVAEWPEAGTVSQGFMIEKAAVNLKKATNFIWVQSSIFSVGYHT